MVLLYRSDEQRVEIDQRRPYRPEFVSQETLRYLLDVEAKVIKSSVERGLLPKPLSICGYDRWHWQTVCEWLFAINGMVKQAGGDLPQQDPFLAGLEAAAAQPSPVRRKKHK